MLQRKIVIRKFDVSISILQLENWIYISAFVLQIHLFRIMPTVSRHRKTIKKTYVLRGRWQRRRGRQDGQCRRYPGYPPPRHY